ncbi:unnamed protein product [Sphenostylis stenocarpa]|uniref:Uncharacterized protein n=1 Tax=Sphenostylis stenocarpa TaxID=92480 RepID=A0AA86T808_9FABA|nr:unnamed protein product [Sphenostylis stenocarpa]
MEREANYVSVLPLGPPYKRKQTTIAVLWKGAQRLLIYSMERYAECGCDTASPTTAKVKRESHICFVEE